jgi:hypothetical protein|nr:PilZ domain-containing protein [Kofleriaceae bacterium]
MREAAVLSDDRGDRRGAVRVPVRGVAVVHGGGLLGKRRGTIENLSRTGALIRVAAVGTAVGDELDVELRVPGLVEGAACGGARVPGRARRVDRGRVAVEFALDRMDDGTRDVLDVAIASAITAALRRPVLVLDDQPDRRRALSVRLIDRGMTPLAPGTPLEAIDMLAQLHVAVCLVSPFQAIDAASFDAMVAESFPWVRTAAISDDLDATLARAAVAWSETDVGQLARALS